MNLTQTAKGNVTLNKKFGLDMTICVMLIKCWDIWNI